jgi:hypothetical protein
VGICEGTPPARALHALRVGGVFLRARDATCV